MISGMYLGELVRLVLVGLIQDGIMFSGKGSDLINQREKFLTKYVTKVESDPPGNYQNAAEVCQKMELTHASEIDYINLRYVCECISTRAAYLCAAGMVTLLHKMGKPNVTIGIDGSLYRFHPTVHNNMVDKMTELCDPKIKVSKRNIGRSSFYYLFSF